MPDAPLTHARVLRIALPIVLSNATIPILGAVDTAVTGQLGQAALMGAEHRPGADAGPVLSGVRASGPVGPARSHGLSQACKPVAGQ